MPCPGEAVILDGVMLFCRDVCFGSFSVAARVEVDLPEEFEDRIKDVLRGVPLWTVAGVELFGGLRDRLLTDFEPFFFLDLFERCVDGFLSGIYLG